MDVDVVEELVATLAVVVVEVSWGCVVVVASVVDVAGAWVDVVDAAVVVGDKLVVVFFGLGCSLIRRD